MSADDEERVLLQVRADELKQKTTKDEGWTELGGCDLCLVQRKSTLDGTPSLLIVARRQDEKSVEVLVSCCIHPNLKYTVARPTFHYFEMERERQCGLSFRSSEEAVAFSNRLIALKEKLGRASRRDKNKRSRSTSNEDEHHTQVKSHQTSGETTSSTPTAVEREHHPTVSEGCDIIHAVHKHNFDETSSPAKQNEKKRDVNSDKNGSDTPTPTAKRIEVGVKQLERCSIEVNADLNYQYVEFIPEEEALKEPVKEPKQSPAHHYTEMASPKQAKDDSDESKKKASKQLDQKRSPVITKQPKKAIDKKCDLHRCMYCHAHYTGSQNHNGACEYAPSHAKSFVRTVTCYSCAEGVAYHCAADSEGDFAKPFSCERDENCGRRWGCLCCLSVFLPCMLCYVPLKSCLAIGKHIHLCGGRHAPN